MRLDPGQIIVPAEKIINYLLVKKIKNDKSNFLERLGYKVENYEELTFDILEIAMDNEAFFSRGSEFGNLYTIQGSLKSSLIITVWVEQFTNNTTVL